MRNFLLALFGLAFVPSFLASGLRAQYAPPRTYSLTTTSDFGPTLMTYKTYRDGSKELIDTSYPPIPQNQKGFHVRSLYDFQAHKIYTWDVIETASPCGLQDYTAASVETFEDPIALSAKQMSELSKEHPKVLGTEIVAGMTAKVEELSGGPGGAKAKIWIAEKGNFPLRWLNIMPDGQQMTMFDITEISFAKPPASLFVLPPACAKTESTGKVSSSATGAHVETQITLPPVSDSVNLTQVSVEYGDGTEVKLKPEEQVAFIFLRDIDKMEDSGCENQDGLGRLCSLDELIKGVKGKNGRTVGFSRNPDEDINYRYTVTISDQRYQAAAVPRHAGLGGFLYISGEASFLGLGDYYYNPNGAATADDKKVAAVQMPAKTFRRE